jgi:hypothetical protein
MQKPRQLTVLVDELIDAHDDTVRLAADLALSDWRWEAHLGYLRELAIFGRAAVAAASDCHGPRRSLQSRSNARTRGSRRCARNGHGEGSA